MDCLKSLQNRPNTRQFLTMIEQYADNLLGGVMIGIASALIFLANGQIAGISGILSNGFLEGKKNFLSWRLSFIIAFLIGTFSMMQIVPESYNLNFFHNTPFYLFPIGGLLVGYGTRTANGCTSGHGICGVGRFSPRSVISTLVFMAVAIVTASFVRGVLGL